MFEVIETIPSKVLNDHRAVLDSIKEVPHLNSDSLILSSAMNLLGTALQAGATFYAANV